ncbi:integral membrane protein [Actinokineospora alba]|uniref:Integral membrane protein n=2 Tax=Actinokineospora alba TaxID=504798 RepID=A0A1H0HQ39_9PSEU|nr:integral membrane protein [Actinokineospora alba]SDH46234.1 integral membrane protein [Actinokineospora alba]SDO21234.1 integral membrane protein [Actinokineospora alba]
MSALTLHTGAMFATPAGRLRIVALAEAVSWVGLLIGMFFKYATDLGEFGVKVFGPIHGAVFVAYIVVVAFTAREQRWNRWTTIWAFASSIPPLATILFERWALRTGKLDPVRARQLI